MLVYHCNIAIDSLHYKMMSFNLVETAMLIASGWLPFDLSCMPGALIAIKYIVGTVKIVVLGVMEYIYLL